ncbi:uncharacterized protein LOC121762191 [Salvia splendens]|uniref:uncharacterized protein LOC121762191 n=1 Tax=Salvia splendens TaxID=180675 RepID=UPI001C274F1C|nr:uncharacterized protein LOC121762191 [Salvia splendens]
MAKRIVPNLLMLKGLLGSNEDVARLLRRCPWFIVSDLEKTLIPNVEILKRCSIPMEHIHHLVYTHPRGFLIKPDIMRKSVDKAIEIGIPLTLIAFIHAVGVFNHTSEEMWEVKLQTLRDLGFSDGGIVTMFRKHPIVFSVSGDKLKNKIELLLATGNIENRLEPRLQILRLLETRNLIEKWPVLSAVSIFTDVRFFDRFVRPYCDVIGEEHITKFVRVLIARVEFSNIGVACSDLISYHC